MTVDTCGASAYGRQWVERPEVHEEVAWTIAGTTCATAGTYEASAYRQQRVGQPEVQGDTNSTSVNFRHCFGVESHPLPHSVFARVNVHSQVGEVLEFGAHR